MLLFESYHQNLETLLGYLRHEWVKRSMTIHVVLGTKESNSFRGTDSRTIKLG